MPHDVSLIATLAAGFGMALILGFVAERLKLPALVGYLVAGILIGPSTPGFVADVAIASQLAEIGVMLLMFGVGLHFSIGDLLAVKRIAVPGAVVHSAQNACDPALGPDSRNGPAWLYRGEPLPHLWDNNRTATWQPWDEGPEPRRHANALLTALQDPQAVARAATHGVNALRRWCRWIAL